MAYKRFGEKAKIKAEEDPTLSQIIEKAQFRIRPEALIAQAMMAMVMGAIAGAVICVVMVVLYLSGIFGDSIIGILLLLVGVMMVIVLPLAAYGMTMSAPSTQMKERAKQVDKQLPYATNYMAAMASANVSVQRIFVGLSGQEIYGEIQTEAKMISRDVEVFGMDMINVLKRAMERSPSLKFQDFLQGIITTTQSGGSLKSYFMMKADQYVKENRVAQHGTLETLGVMAESFVTVVVAMPLFLLVMMSVMAMMGGAGGTTFLWIIVGLMIPLSQFMFVVILSMISAEFD